MCVQNADAERAINKKANLNYRITNQIEENRQEQRNQDDDIRAQDSKSKELSVEMNRLKDAQCYLNLTLFTESDLDRCNEIAEDSRESNSTEQFIDMIQSLANRCTTTNKELEKELRAKQKESIQKRRLNDSQANLEKIRAEKDNMRNRAEEMKTTVANRAKELQGYEQQQKITM